MLKNGLKKALKSAMAWNEKFKTHFFHNHTFVIS